MVQKLYCYVDETGQDTRGNLFIVSVVVTDRNRDIFLDICETIERETGKSRVKWLRTKYPTRIAYIRRIFDQPMFSGRLFFAAYSGTRDYPSLTAETIGKAIRGSGEIDYQAVVLVDALQHKGQQSLGKYLHRLGIKTKKIRGVEKDENDALIRLADAVCGFVRAAKEGQDEMVKLYERGICENILVDLTQV